MGLKKTGKAGAYASAFLRAVVLQQFGERFGIRQDDAGPERLTVGLRQRTGVDLRIEDRFAAAGHGERPARIVGDIRLERRVCRNRRRGKIGARGKKSAGQREDTGRQGDAPLAARPLQGEHVKALHHRKNIL